jgi:hypothetical protein
MNTKTKTSLPPGQPYLSIVVTARNDDHGGNLLHRMQVCVNGLAHQCRKFHLPAELIIVEWNPLPNKKRLSEVIQWPHPLEPLSVRIIEVPNGIHNQIENSDTIPFFQMIAKNAGIRRARGEFVLATNVDIVFSDELMSVLADKSLERDCFYRVDRYDVGSNVIPMDIPFEKQLEFCNENIIRIHGLFGTNKPEHQDSGTGFKIHDNACGDFTLLSRDEWFLLKGYPQLSLYSIHIDSLLVHMAYFRGLIQVILPPPMVIYHIEHELSWAVTQDLSKKYPALDWADDVMPLLKDMYDFGRQINLNDHNWGLSDEPLREYTIGEGSEIFMESIPEAYPSSEDSELIGTITPFVSDKVCDVIQPITIFTLPKAFKKLTGIIQRNAIKSWTKLEPRPEIILFGDDEGTEDIAQELGLRYIPDIKRNEFGTPLMDDLFSQAKSNATNDTLIYVNADIILMSDFMASVHRANTQFDQFLMVGQRWDTRISSPVDFEDPSWENHLRNRIARSGTLQDISAIDYFVFSKNVLPELPPFAIGRTAWDNWIIYTALATKHPVIDASQTIMAVHQNHDYSHAKRLLFDIEINRNRYVAYETFFLCFLSHATWALTPAGFVERPLQKKVFSLCSEGVHLLQTGKPAEALDIFVEILNMILPFPGLYHVSACALAQLSQREDAKKALSDEVALFPHNERARVLLLNMTPPIVPSALVKSEDIISTLREYLTLQ